MENQIQHVYLELHAICNAENIWRYLVSSKQIHKVCG